METIIASENSASFMAGVARVDITPKRLPVLVNGDFFERHFTGIDDPLSVRAIVFSQGVTKIALAVVDSCMLPMELIECAKEIVSETIGLPAHQVMISATHCHSAPSVREIFGAGIDEEYAAMLPERIAEAIRCAHENLQTACVGSAADADAENVFCRRFIMQPGTAWTENKAFTGSCGDIAQMNPEGKEKNIVCPTDRPDPTVNILGVLDENRSPLAVVGNYSTHYVGAEQISADYFAVFASEIAKELRTGEHFLGILSNGTSGDTNSIDFYHPHRQYDRFSVGLSVAQAGRRAFEKIRFSNDVPLEMIESSLELEIRKPEPAQIDLAKKLIGTKKAHELQNREEIYARETLLLAEYPNTVKIKLQAIRIGKLGIVAIPCEVFTSTGREIRRASPLEQTFVISHANGSFGYLPPEEAFFFGGYTTWRARTSLLVPGAERQIRLRALAMLEQLSSHDSSTQ